MLLCGLSWRQDGGAAVWQSEGSCPPELLHQVQRQDCRRLVLDFATSRACRLPCKALMQVAARSKLAVDLQVGSMEHAKAALREAVQLPLQHPHLFAKGSLARCGLQISTTLPLPIPCCMALLAQVSAPQH